MKWQPSAGVLSIIFLMKSTRGGTLFLLFKNAAKASVLDVLRGSSSAQVILQSRAGKSNQKRVHRRNRRRALLVAEVLKLPPTFRNAHEFAVKWQRLHIKHSYKV